ncbi:MAG: energy transducer TonB [Candidatus Latescibacterota bacterium]|nr:MAG: energy transducer TonB [Candidatus Latescibacterota bacterium]
MALAQAAANMEFKAKYGKYIRYSFFGAVFLHAAMFILSPPFEFKPYRLKEEKFEVVELPENIEIPPPPKEIAMPQVPVEAASDDDADEVEELPETTFEDFSDMPPPPPPGGSDSGIFLAFDEPPILIDFVTPKYPDLAREAGFEGTVQVRVLVGEDGKVLAADVLSSDVSPAMEQAAIVAAKKCRFKPAKQRTTPVKAHVMIPFHFRLN